MSRMKESMAALSGGQSVDVKTVLGSSNSALADVGRDGKTVAESRSERQVSLG